MSNFPAIMAKTVFRIFKAPILCFAILASLAPSLHADIAIDELRPATGEQLQADFFNSVAFKGQTVFTAFSPDTGNQLWISDGSANGTQRISNFNSMDPRDRISKLKVFGDRLYFFYQPRDFSSSQVWSTDGHLAGTSQVEGIGQGTEFLFTLKDRIYYRSGGRLIEIDEPSNTATNTGLRIGRLNGGEKHCIAGDGSFALVRLSSDDGYFNQLGIFDGETLRTVTNFGFDTEFESAWILGGFMNQCYLLLQRSTDDSTPGVIARVNRDSEEVEPLAVESHVSLLWMEHADRVYTYSLNTASMRSVMRFNPIEETLETVYQNSDIRGFVRIDDKVFFHSSSDVYTADPDFSNVQRIVQSEGNDGFNSFSVGSPGFAYPADGQVLLFSERSIWSTQGTADSTRLMMTLPDLVTVERTPSFVMQIDIANPRDVMLVQVEDDTYDFAEDKDPALAVLSLQPGLGRGIDGDWVSPDLRDQGLLISTDERADGTPFIFLTWFIHRDGQPWWLVGNVDFEYSDTSVTVPLIEVSGLNAFERDPDLYGERRTLGDARLSMEGCGVLKVDYSLEQVGSSSLIMRKLFGPVARSLCAADAEGAMQ